MKAILLIDEMPSRCFECPYHKTVDGEDENEFKVICNVRYWKEPNQPVENLEERPSWCSLKPLPSKKKHISILGKSGGYAGGFEDGWNACLEEIEGD